VVTEDQTGVTGSEQPNDADTAQSDDGETEGAGAGQEQTQPALQWTYLNFFEPVLVKLKLAGYAGVVISFPYILWQICAFVFPGLKPKEKTAVQILITGGFFLAFTGVAVAYWGVFPVVLNYLPQFAPEGVVGQLRMNENVSLIIKLLLAFALAFQYPMAVLALVYMGLLTTETLKKYRKIAIIISALVGSLLTPPDPGTMCMMMIPLILLYEISIWISYLVVWRRDKSSEEPEV
jgi:sec-independent protein translocase protein TatC